MAISREMREAVLPVLSPVPWILILLPVLSVSDDTNAVTFLFVFTLVVTFFYQMVARTVSTVRSNLAERKNNVPAPDEEYEGSTYRERFWEITHDVFFGVDSEVKPITEYTNSRLFPYLVYSFWGTIASIAAFLLSGVVLARLVTSGNLDSPADIPVPEEVIQATPVGLLDLLLAVFPIFDGLTFENQVLIGGVMLSTGFFFLTAARNLSEISGDIHRRTLRFLVARNPLFKNELLHTLLLIVIYLFLFEIT